jgi:predicted ATP-dependent endonuclease of OLD family
MNLVWFELTGYKRFGKHSKINLAEKLVAIVGPNEAGKTSVLRGLQHLKQPQAFVSKGGSQELSRGVTAKEDDTIAEWTFAIDESDRECLKDIPEAEDLRWYSLTKNKNGKRFFKLTPNPKRSLKLRISVRAELDDALRAVPLVTDADNDPPLVARLQDLAGLLKSDVEDLPKITKEKIAALAEDTLSTEFERFSGRLTDLHTYESSKHPTTRAGAILDERLPDILLFDQDDRDLKAEYDLEKFYRTPTPHIAREKIPTALKSLASAADLDLEELYTVRLNQDLGRVRTILEKAEDRLTDLLHASWSQSKLHLGLNLDGTRFLILLQSETSDFVRVDERSDGLRQFLAFVLFLARQPHSECKPILLIDEAESRLHYDAQADLVQVLSRQELASKIIYTTHSIGCLPEDLGSGIRMVAPEDSYSVIENYFWESKRPGFAPLLFSMGAQTLAFLPMRYAVIAEGAADLILVPAILKAGLKRDSLGFQIVPALASGTSQEIAILHNESARTAYLVDCDSAGKRMKSKIIKAGVREAKIITLPKIEGDESVIEDYIAMDAYLSAVSEELQRSGCTEELSASDLVRPNRPKRLAEWCKAHGVAAPSKRAVAYLVVERKYDLPIVDESACDSVITLYKMIANALGLD